MVARVRIESGNAAVPLLVCVVALATAALIVALLAAGLAHRGGTSQPPWSGDQAPPGAVGLGPEHPHAR